MPVPMGEAEVIDQLRRAERERDLYRRLLQLGRESSVAPLIRSALQALVEAAGARHGYLEIDDTLDDDARPQSISFGYSEEEVDGVRRMVSEGIVSEALLSGEVVQTRSAMEDPRFKGRVSVRASQIEAVLCAPIQGVRARGVVYLQGSAERTGFSDEARALVEAFAHFLGPIADRILFEQRRIFEGDPTQALRGGLRCEAVVGRSPALARVLSDVAAAAPLDIHVLLTGDSGTGKTLLARVIHESGPRAGKPFVELNCAAFPQDLLENELFGHEQGAFSGAVRTMCGKVEAADGGTLFLDEIGELAPTSQAKLLQLLHSGVYYRLGGNQERRSSARIVAATNTDLERAVAEGRFRQDLLYRLQVLPIRVPSLSERREDLRDLVDRFVEIASERHGLAKLRVSPRGLAAIEAAEWPGNIRQLEHVVTAGIVRATSARTPHVTEEHLFPHEALGQADPSESLGFQEATRGFQRGLLERTLRESNWSVTEAARRLDIHRSYAYKLVDAFGLGRDRRS